jgi:hypothetical protein
MMFLCHTYMTRVEEAKHPTEECAHYLPNLSASNQSVTNALLTIVATTMPRHTPSTWKVAICASSTPVRYKHHISSSHSQVCNISHAVLRSPLGAHCHVTQITERLHLRVPHPQVHLSHS